MLEHKDFLIFSEYYNGLEEDLFKLSVDTEKTVLSGIQDFVGVKAVIIKNGKLIHYRYKHRLTSGEMLIMGHQRGTLPKPYNVDDKNVLQLMCYEICFPEDFYNLDNKIDLIVHHIGFPMYDRNQYIAWEALQKAAVEHFKCPLVSVCGGKNNSLNLTHKLYHSSFQTTSEKEKTL